MSYGPPPPGGYGPPPTGGYPPPGGGYGGYPQQPPAGGPPKNYMVFNIIGIFTCTVVGIIGLVFALQVNSKWEMGDYAGADSSAKVAKIMGIISMVGLALWVLYFLFIIVMVIIGVSTAPTTTGYNY